MSGADRQFEFQLLDEQIRVVAGNAEPTSLVASMTPVSPTGSGSLRFLSAAPDEGMGTYTLVPTFRLLTPYGSAASVYPASVVVDIAAGP